MVNEREWLEAEQRDQDAIAEGAFARVVAETPPIEPHADFVGRTVQAAWRARTRRCVLLRRARVAAALLIGIVTLGSMYEFSFLIVPLVVRGAVAFSHGLVWLLTSASEEARWWWIGQRIGKAVGDAITAPLMVAAVAALEIIDLLAIYAFHRLVQDERGTRESKEVRI